METGINDSKNNPKDEQVIVNMLKEMGVTDYEPGVVNHLMNFSYRYTTDILEDARVYSAYAKKKTIDVQDVSLAINMRQEQSFISPPSKELIAEAAAARNAVPLPCVKSSMGPKLPADRYTLTSANYRLKPSAKRRTLQNMSKLNLAGGMAPIGLRRSVPASFIRTNPAFTQKLGSLAAVSMSRPIVTVAKPAKPILQVTESVSSTPTPSHVESASTVVNASSMSASHMFPTAGAATSLASLSTEVPNYVKPPVCDA